MCPLAVAVTHGLVGVVWVLINEGGIRAVGGGLAMPKSLYVAVCFHRARILRLLLTMDGEERRLEWANTVNCFCGKRLRNCGAAHCYSAEVSVLLEAGADEAVPDSQGCTAQDYFGMSVSRDSGGIDRGDEAAIRRVLERGPAYRARSWAWPCEEEADAGGRDGDGDAVAAAPPPAVAVAAAVLLPPLVVKPPPVVSLRIFRPKEKKSSHSKLFVRLVGR